MLIYGVLVHPELGRGTEVPIAAVRDGNVENSRQRIQGSAGK